MGEPATKDDIERVVSLVQSLTERMDQRFDEMADRFDSQGSRLDRHAGLLQTGNRWSVRMSDWAERVDAALESKDRQIAQLSERVRKIEDQNRPAA